MASEIHLIGIGGVGMSALAQAFLDAGFTVTGADRSLGDGSGARSPVLQELERQGVRLFPDDGSGVLSTTARVVISTAVEETNPGLRRARELGVPVTHRAAALAEVLDVSPKALDVPDIDSYTGLMHTLFTLEDRYGLEVCESDDEVHLRVHIQKGRDAAELHKMLAAWGAVSRRRARNS